MKITLFTACALLQMAGVLIDDDGYKMPPKAIVDIVDAPMTPRISISPDKKHVLLLERPSLPSIKELAQPELRLAGVRINPTVNGRSRAAVYTSITIKNIETFGNKRTKWEPKFKPRIEFVNNVEGIKYMDSYLIANMRIMTDNML